METVMRSTRRTGCGLGRPWANGIRAALACCLALLSTAPANAVRPQQWSHTAEADFASGETDKTIVTNLGDIKLATSATEIGQVPGQTQVIYDLQAVANGDVYLATGRDAALLRLSGEQVDEVLGLTDGEVFALDLTADGDLLVAVSGKQARLAVLRDGDLETLQLLGETRYIWDVLVAGRRVYLATGTEGKLLMVDLSRPQDDQNAVVELLDTKQSNLLCLASDDQGRVYAGTDTDGLVYRVTVADDGSVEAFVLHDADEPEIGALLVTKDGTVYAGTADAEQAKPGRLEDAVVAEHGRPDLDAAAEDAEPPADIPQVPPGPEPIGRGAAGVQQTADDSTPTEADAAEADSPADTASPTRQSTTTHRPVFRAYAAVSTAQNAEGDDAPTPTPGEESRAHPTTEQRDRLRELIRKRLLSARESGTLDSPRGKLITSPERKRPKRSPASGSSSSSSDKQGNAVYRISPEGFVTEVFRDSVMVLALIERGHGGGEILVATGNEGQLFSVSPGADETATVAELDSQQVSALLTQDDGRVLLGTSNPAKLYRLENSYAQQGTYTSESLDAGQTSLWGGLNVTTRVPEGTSVAVQTRSGNVQDPDVAAWAPWSDPVSFDHQPDAEPASPRHTQIASPPARFFQYRLVLSTDDGEVTAAVDRVDATYVTPNLRPRITSIQTEYPGQDDDPADSDGEDPAPLTKLQVSWEADDPNGDQLRYNLEYQPAGTTRWMLLKEDVKSDSYEWATRRVPDGWYTLRVTASDKPDNPGDMAAEATRRSDPLLIDNTPPAMLDTRKTTDQGRTTITLTARDALSRIRAAHYTVDSDEDWRALLPNDLIYDSTEEALTINIIDLEPGPHVVTLRVLDAVNNARYESVLLEVK